MNEKWVIEKISELEQITPTGGGIKYSPDSADKTFTIGVDANGSIYVELSVTENGDEND